MKVRNVYFDQIFDYRGQWDVPSKCGLKIVRSEQKTCIVATELYQDNPGSSITSVAQSLFEQICSAFGLDPNTVHYIECAPSTDSKLSFYDQEFFRVTFENNTPHYHKIERIETYLDSAAL